MNLRKKEKDPVMHVVYQESAWISGNGHSTEGKEKQASARFAGRSKHANSCDTAETKSKREEK